MDTIVLTETIILHYLKSLPIADQRNIMNGNDILFAIEEDAETEIMHEVWNDIKNNLSYKSILTKLKLHLSNMPESDSEEEEEVEEEEEEVED
jgi:hypothetical protein